MCISHLCRLYDLSALNCERYSLPWFSSIQQPWKCVLNVKQRSRCVYILCGCYYFTSAKVEKNLDEKAERNSSMGTELRVMTTLLTSYMKLENKFPSFRMRNLNSFITQKLNWISIMNRLHHKRCQINNNYRSASGTSDVGDGFHIHTV